MATSTHYPPSLLPWQGPNSDSTGARVWHLDITERAGRADLIVVTLSMHVNPAGWWGWTLTPYNFHLPVQTSRLFQSSTFCEMDLLHRLAHWLHWAPPSRHLPPQEGATSRGKEADCA